MYTYVNAIIELINDCPCAVFTLSVKDVFVGNKVDAGGVKYPTAHAAVVNSGGLEPTPIVMNEGPFITTNDTGMPRALHPSNTHYSI